MDSQPTFDRGLILPILIGGFSVVGIVFVLLIGRSLNSPAEVPMTPSMTPFEYLFLGTEPGALTSVVEGSEIAPTEEPIDEPVNATPVFVTPTVLSLPTSLATRSNVTSTPITVILRTGTPTLIGLATATSTLSSPVSPNTYDDTDARLAYSGTWVSQTNVSGTYQNTLHVSDSASAGNSLTFTFTGQEIQLFYQAGSSLGTVTITFDNETLGISLNQAQSSGPWVYLLDTAGTHTVVIRHTGGGAVNIDRLVIPGLTATPTRTLTPTLTPTQ